MFYKSCFKIIFYSTKFFYTARKATQLPENNYRRHLMLKFNSYRYAFAKVTCKDCQAYALCLTQRSLKKERKKESPQHVLNNSPTPPRCCDTPAPGIALPINPSTWSTAVACFSIYSSGSYGFLPLDEIKTDKLPESEVTRHAGILNTSTENSRPEVNWR